MHTRSLAMALTAVAALTACQATETAEQMHTRMQTESDSARVALEAKAAAFAEAFNAKNADALAAFYAPDAVLMPPDMPAVTGRDAIQAGFAQMAAQMPDGSVFALHMGAVTANGPLAIERGEWTQTTTGPDGAPVVMRGKYLVHWVKTNGEWLIASDIWNNDAQMPPM